MLKSKDNTFPEHINQRDVYFCQQLCIYLTISKGQFIIIFILDLMSQNQQASIENHVLSRFTVIKKIGSGAYGHVWKVQDKVSKRIYALKKIFDAFQHSTDAQRTYRQIEVLKQIDHPNIIKLYQTIKAQNNKDVYLVFEFMQADLHNVIAEGILKEVHIRFIIYQLAKALKYLHSGLVIHRDLKPSNILINSNCTIKLCDFGLVRTLIGSSETGPVLTEGVATRWYRAPEVLLGSTSYSTPADIWSFGCIIYEIVCQKPMFAGQSTTDQIHKILAYTGYPTEQQIKSLKSNVVRSVLKESKIPYYNSTAKQFLKDLPPLVGELIGRMTTLNLKQRITVDQILNHEAVQPFRKKQQQIECQKFIMTQISDNKKLTVVQYRDLVYGIKKPQAELNSTKKSLSSTQLTSTNFNSSFGDKYTMKYVKSKELLQYNRSSDQMGETSNKMKQQKFSQLKKETLKDPTRVTYISKNFYTPKNFESSKPSYINNSISNVNSSAPYKYSQNISYTSSPALNQSSQVTSPKIVPTFVASTSPYIAQRKPGLYKSSKYSITKTQQSMKE